jgi:glycosyltransferase involved in cell wall biosynthesis
MNPVFINNSVETFTPTQSGAIATHIRELCRAAQSRNFDPVVISIGCDAPPYEGVRSILVDPPVIPTSPFLFKMHRARRKITGWRHVRQNAFARDVARAIRREGLADAPMILNNDPELAAYLKEKFPRAFIIHHFHNQIDTAPQFRSRFLKAVNVITAVSDFTGRWIEQAYALPPNTVRPIHNGVDTDLFTPAPNPGNRLPVVNFVGRTGIEKAPDLLLKAAAKVAETTRQFAVQILGSNHWDKFERDAYQDELDGLTGDLERAGIQVLRPGHVTRSALPDALRKADVHVVPSRWDEPCALTLFEGMATGLPVVASRTGGTPEIVGDAGLLFERDSVDGLAAHLTALITDSALRSEYARRARARAEQFTWVQTWGKFQAAAGI